MLWILNDIFGLIWSIEGGVGLYCQSLDLLCEGGLSVAVGQTLQAEVPVEATPTTPEEALLHVQHGLLLCEIRCRVGNCASCLRTAVLFGTPCALLPACRWSHRLTWLDLPNHQRPRSVGIWDMGNA